MSNITISFNERTGLITEAQSVGSWKPPANILGQRIDTVIKELLEGNKLFSVKKIELSGNRVTVLNSSSITTEDLLKAHLPNEVLQSAEYQKQSKEIIEFLRRVKKEELKQRLIEIGNWPNLTPEVIDALKNSKWDHPIYQNPKIELYALKAFVSGHLTRDEISSIFIHAECTKRNPGSESMQLFSSQGVRNEKAVQIFRNSLKDNYTEQQIDNIIQEMSQLDPRKTQFYSIPFSEKNGFSIVNGIIAIKHQFLIHKNEQEENHQTVLPPHLLQIVLEEKFKGQTMLPNLVLGESIALSNFQFPEKRDVLIPCSLFPKSTPNEADGFFDLSPIAFYHHDAAFHLYFESANPHRKAWVELAKHFSSKTTQTVKCDHLNNLLHDRDFPPYKRSLSGISTPGEAFRKTLLIIKDALNRKDEPGDLFYSQACDFLEKSLDASFQKDEETHWTSGMSNAISRLKLSNSPSSHRPWE